MKCEFLNELTFNRVMEFNSLLQEQRFYPSDIIYDQDSDSNVFYIVKRGKVAIQTIVELESENIYPNNKKWNVLKTKKKCMYMVRELKAGEIFGHEELLMHFKNVQKSGNGRTTVPSR